MNRRFTNVIRFFLDECLPPLLRDNRFFMYPFFWLAYRGRNVRETMEFKSRVLNFTPAEYQQFYAQLDSISRNRATDLNPACLAAILGALDDKVTSLLDAGCGSGYLLKRIHEAHPRIALTGSDIVPAPPDLPGRYYQGELTDMQPEEGSFDVVTCSHVLEHILDLKAAVRTLRSLSRKLVVIVVPCQRYYYYTLDEHVHFFTHEHQIYSLMGLEREVVLDCRKLDGDWFLLVRGYDA
ncbi:MAG: class I SAM-dependent methyltransferase [Pseudomonadota bacterium]|nr:class I SAM-dependent methyltransferase [Pseudomonadota bacterium]